MNFIYKKKPLTLGGLIFYTHEKFMCLQLANTSIPQKPPASKIASKIPNLASLQIETIATKARQ